MPADTPKYGGSKVELNQAISKAESVKPNIDQIKENAKLAESEEQVLAVEKKVEAGGPGQVGARKKVTQAIAEQTKALDANKTALSAESDIIKANTELWLANAEARKLAAGVKFTPSVASAPAGAGTVESQAATIDSYKAVGAAAQSSATTQVAAAREATVALEAQAAATERLARARAIPNYSALNLQPGGFAGGSNDAQFATANGQKFIAKQYGGDLNRISSELLANQVYRELGIRTPSAGIGQVGGQPALVSPFLQGAAPKKITEAYRGIQKGFVADSLLGNWDVFGFEGNAAHENILFDPRNRPYRIDQGGALQYKGMTGQKPFEGVLPPELVSLKEHNAAKYGDLSEETIRAQAAQAVSTLTPGRVKQLVAAQPFTDQAQAKQIEEALNGRVAALDQYAKGLIDIEGKAIAGSKQVEQSITAAPKLSSLEQAQQDLLSAYNLSYAERSALRSAGTPKPLGGGVYDSEARGSRFQQRLFRAGLTKGPKGAERSVAGEQVLAALEANPQYGATPAAIALDEAAAYRAQPGFAIPGGAREAFYLEGKSDTEVRRYLDNQFKGSNVDSLHSFFGGTGSIGYDKTSAQNAVLKDWIEKRSRAVAELEGLVDEKGNLTAYRAGPVGGLAQPGAVSRLSFRPLPAFESQHSQPNLAYPLRATALRAYAPAVLQSGFGFEYEEEIAVSSAQARKALERRAKQVFDSKAAAAATTTPELIQGLDASAVNDLLLARIYGSSASYKHKPTEGLLNSGLGTQGYPGYGGGFKLNQEGQRIADELLKANVLGYRKYVHPVTAGATGTEYHDAYPGTTTTEQRIALEKVAAAQAHISSTAGFTTTQVEANEAVGSSTIRLAKVEEEQATKAVSLDEAIAAAAKVKAQEVVAANEAIAASGGGGGRGGGRPPTAQGFPEDDPRRRVEQLLLTAGPTGKYGYGTPPVNILPGDRAFIAGRGGVLTGEEHGYEHVPTINPEEVGTLGVLTESQKAAIASSSQLVAAQEAEGLAMGRVNGIIRQNAAELASASTAIQRHGALSTEFIGSLARGEVTLREFGAATVATIGKFGGWAVAGGLVYGAYESLKRITEGAKATSVGVTQLERAGIPNFDPGRAKQSFLDISKQLNLPIGGKTGVYEAEFYATRAGFRNQPEVEKAAVTALEAQKLDLVPIQDGTKALGALRTAFGLNADEIHRVFEELDVGQLRFNARLNQTLPQIGRAASAVANAGGNVHELAQQLIVVTGATGGGGGQGGGNPATFFLREAGNIRKAGSQAILRSLGFDPNEAAQNVTKFNKELAERAGGLSKAQRLSAAEAIGGGTAIGGRYAIALINAGPSGRLAEVEKQAGHPGDALNEDLGRKLAQFDEKVKKVGLTFERLGAEIGSVGLTAVAENTFNLFNVLGHGLEHLASPLGRVGSLVNAIPGPLQELAVALVALAGGSKLLGGGRLAGLSRTAGEAVRYLPFGDAISGYINSPQRSVLRDTNRTLSEEESRIKGRIEGLAQRQEARGPELRDVTAEKERLTAILQARGPQYAGTREGAGVTAQLSEETKRATQLEAQNERDRRSLAREQEGLVENARLRAGTKLGGADFAAREGLVLGTGGGGVLRGATGPQGSYYQALLAAGQSGKAFAPGSRITAEVEAALRSQAKAGGDAAAAEEAFALEQAKIAATLGIAGKEQADTTIRNTADLKVALGDFVGQVESGAEQVSASLKALVLALAAGEGGLAAEAGVGALGGLGKGIGAGGKLLGGLTSGGLLFKGLNTALLGSLAAELVGSAVGGGAGKAIGNVGSDAAIGAGLGLAVPIIGPVAGGIAGGLFGIGKELLTEGGPSAAVAAQQTREAAQKRQQTEYENALKTGGSGRQQLQTISEEFALELETAFGEDAKAAEGAKKNIEKGLRQAGANLKLFGLSGAKGTGISKQVLAQATATELAVVASPDTVDQSAELLEKQEQTVIAAAEEEYSREIKAAKTTKQFTQAGNRLQAAYRDLHQALVVEPGKRLQERIKETEEGEKALEKPDFSDGPLALHKKTKGLGQSKSTLDARQVSKNQADSRKRVEEYQKQIADEEKLLDTERAGRSLPGFTGKLSSNPFAKQPALGLSGANLKSVEQEEKARETKIAQLHRELDKLSTLIVTHPYQDNAALFAQYQAKERQIAGLKAEQGTLNALTSRLNARLAEFAGESKRVEAIGNLEAAYQSQNETKLAEAGPDPAAKAKVQKKIDAEERSRRSAITNGHVPRSIKEAEKRKGIGEHQEAEERKAQEAERNEQAALAGIPNSNAQGRKDAEIRFAREKVSELARRVKSKTATPGELQDAQTKLAQLQTSSAEQTTDEASSLISAQGALQQARDAGDAVKQAQDAVSTAAQQIGAAKTPSERISAEAALIQARTQLHEAHQSRIEERGALEESQTSDPLRRAAEKVARDRKLLKGAVGPDEKYQRETSLNNDIRSEREARVTEEEDVIKSEEHLHKITNDQAVRKLQGILARLKRIKAAPAEIRRVEEEIYDAQNESQADFAVGSIAHTPTLYDAKTIGAQARERVRAVAAAASRPPSIVGEHEQRSTGSGTIATHGGGSRTPRFEQHNLIQINLSGGHPGQLASELERVFGSLTRAQMRSAGLR